MNQSASAGLVRTLLHTDVSAMMGLNQRTWHDDLMGNPRGAGISALSVTEIGPIGACRRDIVVGDLELARPTA